MVALATAGAAYSGYFMLMEGGRRRREE